MNSSYLVARAGEFVFIAVRNGILPASMAFFGSIAYGGTITQMRCSASDGGQIIQANPCTNFQTYASSYARFTVDGLLSASSDASAYSMNAPYDPNRGAFTPSAAAQSTVQMDWTLLFPGQVGVGTFSMAYLYNVFFGGGGLGRGAIRSTLDMGSVQYNVMNFAQSFPQVLTGTVDLGSPFHIVLWMETVASTAYPTDSQFSSIYFRLQSLTFTDANGQNVIADTVPEPSTVGMVGLVAIGWLLRSASPGQSDLYRR